MGHSKWDSNPRNQETVFGESVTGGCMFPPRRFLIRQLIAHYEIITWRACWPKRASLRCNNVVSIFVMFTFSWNILICKISSKISKPEERCVESKTINIQTIRTLFCNQFSKFFFTKTLKKWMCNFRACERIEENGGEYSHRTYSTVSCWTKKSPRYQENGSILK